MKKLLLALIFLLNFQNVKAAPIDDLANLFSDAQRAQIIEFWQGSKCIFICKERETNSGWVSVTQTLPKGFWDKLQQPLLPEMRDLRLVDCNLESIPFALNCPQLETLILKANKLESIDLSQCPKLKWLGLDGNPLKAPPHLSCCPKLHILSMGACGLKTLPNLSGCEDLAILDLSHNALTETPDLSGFNELESLRLNHNRLTQTPDLSTCTDLLETLDLSNNAFTETPDLSQHRALKNLNLNGNYFTEMPTLHKCAKASIHLSWWHQKKREGIFEDA